MTLPGFSALQGAILREIERVASSQYSLRIDPPPGFREGHRRAGQFCKIAIAGEEGIFAMASAPGDDPLFLIRTGATAGGDAADRLAAAQPGAPLAMSSPAGEGFALERARGRDLWALATGTGIAPVRAAIVSALRERGAYGAIHLLHGVRSAEYVALADDLARWRVAGVDVELCFSQPSADGSLRGATVQDRLRARAPDLREAALIAVGQPEMLLAAADAASALGLAPERLLLNV